MPNEIFMPKLSSTMAEGTVIEWFKDEGDSIEVGEPILEIMTDKINIEVESYHEGTLLKKYFESDDAVPVNHVIGYIGEEGEDVPETPPGESKEASQEDGAEDENKNTPEADVQMKGSKEKNNADNSNNVSGTRESALGKIRATPAARALARNKEIDMHEVTGSGRNGRIHKQDVENHQPDPSSNTAQPVTDTAATEEIQTEKLKGSRKITADRMAESSSTIPHVTIDFEVEMDSLIELRSQVNHQNQDDKVSFNDIFILIISKALTKHPDINITFENGKIHYHEAKNIGLAVAVDQELLVPVLKNTEIKSLLSIRNETKSLIKKSRDKQLSPDTMQGGTFTISNLGMYNIKQFTPIINKPQAAILGISGTSDKPSVENGQLINKKVATLSLSFDHRVINGAPAAAFCNTIKQLAENPIELIF